MPRYTVGTNNSLPPRTLEYLARGASVGSRHNELFAAACQFRDCGYDLDETAKQCVPRAVKDGLDEAEAAKTVASVFRYTPRGRPRRTSTASSHTSTGGVGAGLSEEAAPFPQLTPEKLPDPIPDGLRVLVETLFKPREGIAIGAGFKGASGNLVIDRGVVRTWDRWQVAFQKRSLKQMNHAGNGLFFRINPMGRGGASDAEVTSLRHALAEFDADENGSLISKEIQ
jgi:Primase C terminal 1 (PriCT-1)